MDDFNKVAEELLNQKQALQAKYQEARSSAIAHVQQIIKDFKIKAVDLEFAEEPKVRKPRTPAAVKYRLPNGEEWTGQGQMKKTFKEYKHLYYSKISDKEFLAKFRIPEKTEAKETKEAKEVKETKK
nr:MAG TPA: H-NS histone family [Caudoviricetes sp.]